MTFRGHVSSMSLDEVFGLIASNGLEGTLVLSTETASVQLYFAQSAMIVPRWITGLDESASADLIAARRKRCSKALQQLFACRDASYVFRPNELPSDLLAPTSLRFDPQAVIMDRARRKDETRRVGRVGLGDSQDSDVWGLSGRPRPIVQGDLEGVGLPALLQCLRSRRRTGTLKVGTHERWERIYFHDGEAFILRSDEPQDPLTLALLGESQAGLPTGDAGESQRARDRFLEVLFWQGAAFRFVPDKLPPRFDERRIALETDRFLMQAIQRLEAWEQLQTVLDGGDAVFRFMSTEGKLKAVRERGAADLLTLVDGLRSFDDMVARVATPRLEAAQVVAALFREGHLVRCLKTPKSGRQPTTLDRGLMAAS